MAEQVDSVNIKRVLGENHSEEPDLVVVEEPLEIRIGYGPDVNRKQVTITVTMRTPGDDEHLCLGFIFTEGMIHSPKEVISAKYCTNMGEEDGGENVMRIELSSETEFNPNDHKRNFYTNSSCGVCGKASIEHVKQSCQPVAATDLKVSGKTISELPQVLEEAQDVFKHTGGLHACGLFDVNGKLLRHKEDVGRHNALDKLIGSLILENRLPANDNILILSGRISFE